MRRKTLKIVWIGLAAIMAIFVLIQLIPFGRDHSHPPVIAEPAWDSPRTRELFLRACGDCHSNETKWPWYSNIAPVSWWITHHVDEGRSKLNVSQFGAIEDHSEHAAEVVSEGEMPLKSYLFEHPEARLSETEKQDLINGLLATFGGELGGHHHED